MLRFPIFRPMDRLFSELLAAVHAVLVSVPSSFRMNLFAASLGGNRRVDNLGTVGTKAHRRVCFSMVKVGTRCDVHLVSFGFVLETRAPPVRSIRFASPNQSGRRGLPTCGSLIETATTSAWLLWGTLMPLRMSFIYNGRQIRPSELEGDQDDGQLPRASRRGDM